MTLEDLYDRIRQTAHDKSVNVWEAMSIVHAEIAADPAQATAFVEGVGLWCLRHIEREVARRASTPAPVCPTDVPRRAKGKSWRERLNPLDAEFQVAGTGVRKRIGSFTGLDLQAIVDMYKGFADAHRTMQRHWTAIRQHVADNETLESAVHRLSEKELLFLAREVKLDPDELRFAGAAKAA